MVRMTINAEKLTRVELIPFTIDDEGPLYGVRGWRARRGPRDHRARPAAVRAVRDADRRQGWYARSRSNRRPPRSRGQGRRAALAGGPCCRFDRVRGPDYLPAPASAATWVWAGAIPGTGSHPCRGAAAPTGSGCRRGPCQEELHLGRSRLAMRVTIGMFMPAPPAALFITTRSSST